MGEMIAAHAMVVLEVPDDGLDGGAPFHLPLDLQRETALLTGGVDFELVFRCAGSFSEDYIYGPRC